MTECGSQQDGTVLGAVGGTYQVRLDRGDVVDAVLRGRLKLVQRTGNGVVAGDSVQVLQQDETYTIENVAERRSQLARRAPGRGGRRAKVIVANIEQIVIVFAAKSPDPRWRMLDRFLVVAEANSLHALIILNKVDLLEGEAAGVLCAYESAGYAVVRTSVRTGQGMPEVRERLCGHWSVLTGPSGVGKSSLLNALQPGLGLRVAEIGVASRKGRHTTVSARLIPLDCGGYVADTPGLRELGLWGIERDELRDLFPEFRGLSDECRFGRSCSHVHEPQCAVRAAVGSGAIDRERYDSYVALREEDGG
ncbi:MAG: ribosome small subunit-dependent GTPase A [Longimicrobiales bacterium]